MKGMTENGLYFSGIVLLLFFCGPQIKNTTKHITKGVLTMNFKWKSAAVLSLMALISMEMTAQVEVISDALYQKSVKAIPVLREAAKNPYLKAYLADPGKGRRHIVSAARVAADVNENPAFAGKVAHYAVPAMSGLQRLPDMYPEDGKALDVVRILTAKDEYEPGSFVVYPFENLGKVEFKLTPFKTADGKVLPADKLDLKVIKVWYQNKNAWYNYFSDDGLKLCPELLLNDEDLIKVDTEKVANFARLTEEDGTVRYHWLTPPPQINARYGSPTYRYFRPFQCMKPNFRDAKTLQPVTLNKGEFKQFFLTVHAEKNQAAGIYKGAVNMVKDGAKIGEIPVAVRVLPFELPVPHTYADPNRRMAVAFYHYSSFMYILSENGNDYELACKQLRNMLANQVRHNQSMHVIQSREWDREFYETLAAMKETGVRTDFMICNLGLASPTQPLDMKHDAKLKRKQFTDLLGHNNICFTVGDEPPISWVRRMLPVYEIYQSEGFKFFIAGKHQVFYGAGHLYDFFNTAFNPRNREATRPWNEVGHAFVAWYADQHVGVENPDFNRRQNGMAPYLANYSALCNYAHHFGPYNDRTIGAYKPMVFAYGSGDGLIDTLQWEGFREGLDDIRYATALKRLALEAKENKDIKISYAGRQALKMFALLNTDKANLDSVRYEMVERILELRKMLKK